MWIMFCPVCPVCGQFQVIRIACVSSATTFSREHIKLQIASSGTQDVPLLLLLWGRPPWKEVTTVLMIRGLTITFLWRDNPATEAEATRGPPDLPPHHHQYSASLVSSLPSSPPLLPFSKTPRLCLAWQPVNASSPPLNTMFNFVCVKFLENFKGL